MSKARMDDPWTFGARIFHQWKVRFAATVALLFAGLLSVVVFLIVVAGRLAWYDSLGVVLAIFLAVPVAVFLLWISWGFHLRRRLREWRGGPPFY